MSIDSAVDSPGRRRFLARITTGLFTVIGSIVGVIVGGAVVSTRFARQEENWLPAGSLAGLTENEPTPVTLRVSRQDGYREVVDRRTIFLVKTGDTAVTALDSTCTHLGCRVSWDPQAQLLKCPCHGGVYDRRGVVEAGPPPAPLSTMATRIEGDMVLIQV